MPQGMRSAPHALNLRLGTLDLQGEECLIEPARGPALRLVLSGLTPTAGLPFCRLARSGIPIQTLLLKRAGLACIRD